MKRIIRELSHQFIDPNKLMNNRNFKTCDDDAIISHKGLKPKDIENISSSQDRSLKFITILLVLRHDSAPPS